MLYIDFQYFMNAIIENEITNITIDLYI